MPKPIHKINIEFGHCQWFRLLSTAQRRRLCLTFASACPSKPPRSFVLENIDTEFFLCARSPMNECRDEYVLINGLPVPVRLCLQPNPLDHYLSKVLSYNAICVKHGQVPIVFVDAVLTTIGGRLYPVQTAWDAIYATVTECKDIVDARCIAEAWIATTAGKEMHVRVDDWQDRILSRRDRDEAAKLHQMAERLLRELANPNGYFQSLEEYRESKKLTLPMLPDDFRPDPLSPF